MSDAPETDELGSVARVGENPERLLEGWRMPDGLTAKDVRAAVGLLWDWADHWSDYNTEVRDLEDPALSDEAIVMRIYELLKARDTTLQPKG